MGARVMDLGDHLELSGAIYPFAMLREAGVIAQVRAALQADMSTQSSQELAELAIARSWRAGPPARRAARRLGIERGPSRHSSSRPRSSAPTEP